MKRLGWIVAAAMLGGCVTTPAPAIRGDSLAGRLTVQVAPTATSEGRKISASFDLQGTPLLGQLDLSTPLGTVLAQARWAPDKVTLVTSQGESRFASLDDLTREVLGESLPVAALFDWLRGRPWSGASSTPSTAPVERGFQQLGWQVSLARFDEGWVTARREQAPAVTVRAKIDRP